MWSANKGMSWNGGHESESSNQMNLHDLPNDCLQSILARTDQTINRLLQLRLVHSRWRITIETHLRAQKSLLLLGSLNQVLNAITRNWKNLLTFGRHEALNNRGIHCRDSVVASTFLTSLLPNLEQLELHIDSSNEYVVLMLLEQWSPSLRSLTVRGFPRYPPNHVLMHSLWFRIDRMPALRQLSLDVLFHGIYLPAEWSVLRRLEFFRFEGYWDTKYAIPQHENDLFRSLFGQLQHTTLRHLELGQFVRFNRTTNQPDQEDDDKEDNNNNNNSSNDNDTFDDFAWLLSAKRTMCGNLRHLRIDCAQSSAHILKRKYAFTQVFVALQRLHLRLLPMDSVLRRFRQLPATFGALTHLQISLREKDMAQIEGLLLHFESEVIKFIVPFFEDIVALKFPVLQNLSFEIKTWNEDPFKYKSFEQKLLECIRKVEKPQQLHLVTINCGNEAKFETRRRDGGIDQID